MSFLPSSLNPFANGPHSFDESDYSGEFYDVDSQDDFSSHPCSHHDNDTFASIERLRALNPSQQQTIHGFPRTQNPYPTNSETSHILTSLFNKEVSTQAPCTSSFLAELLQFANTQDFNKITFDPNVIRALQYSEELPAVLAKGMQSRQIATIDASAQKAIDLLSSGNGIDQHSANALAKTYADNVSAALCTAICSTAEETGYLNDKFLDTRTNHITTLQSIINNRSAHPWISNETASILENAITALEQGRTFSLDDPTLGKKSFYGLQVYAILCTLVNNFG